ncbi:MULTISPECIES: HNH endonuclease [Streptococcus]|uniref:HNH endonuclease n=1 Tax=Streptococcus TaxID=1301 RepID=UPI000BA30F8D|nr:HNH endonuclease [Streptococcus acidominimus]
MKPQRLTITNGRRTMVEYDSRSEEYQSYNRNRWKYDRDVKRFYNSKAWRETSKIVLLKANYVCAMCGGEATMTDHIISVKQDWSKRLDIDNLQASCKACNDAKALREKYSY